jgi:putative hydrolase of the HAD superfamily
MNTFILDYDDTLAFNQHYYSYAQAALIKLILDRLGPRAPNAQSIINREVDIDKGLVTTLGFRKERFPTSFRQVYAEIAKAMNVEDPVGENDAYDIGLGVFDKKKWRRTGLVPGAKETLNFLKEIGDELILFTAGNQEVQTQKIEATGVRVWFGENIYIVERKDEAAMRRVIGDRNKQRTWMVGNSMRSDILPALAAGIGALYIPQETWAYEAEHAGVPKDNPRLVTLREIADIKKWYDKLFS